MVLVTDVYEFEQIIGEGSFSSVVLATHNETKNKCAIKIIDKSKIVTDVQRERADREIAILKMCNHPNIVKLVETFESDDEISLVMELMSGGDLFDRITSKGVFTEQEARVSMRHILSAVDFLHDRSIVHRDLKPENLLYSAQDNDSCVKLSDFGLSKFSTEKDNDGLQTPCGTIAYTAPEITHSKVYRKGVDIWSCGCILYFMLFGRPPFYSENEDEIYDLVSEGVWAFPESNVSELAKDLVKRLLEQDPNKRLTVKQAMAHPFLTQKEQPSISRAASQISPDTTTSPNIPVPAIVFTVSALGSTPPTSSLSLSLSQPAQPTPPVSPSPSSTAAQTSPLAIPHLRASMHSAIDAQRGPLTPPLVSPLESNIWKKRAKTRALQHSNTTDLSLDLSATSPNDDKNGFNDIIKSENDPKFSEMMDVDLGLTY
jgi:calcium/calmodulin-dependent protein kinase I